MEYSQVSSALVDLITKMTENGKSKDYQIGILIGTISMLVSDMPSKDAQRVIKNIEKVAA